MGALLELVIFYLLIFIGNCMIFGVVYLVGRRFEKATPPMPSSTKET